MDLGKRAASIVLMTGLMAGGLFLSGCDDNVEILRDPDIRVARGMTWAWRPLNAPEGARREPAGKGVVSRDVIAPESQPQAAPRQRLESNRDWNTEANRDTLKAAIAKNLQKRGLTQTTDPAVADFWVDYHVAVRTQNATVERVYPGYPGVACGPYGCWSGWGWGPPEVAFQNVRYHEGTFVIDVALREPRKLAYRAISRKELNNKHTISPYQADEAVEHLLKGLKTK
ncbi:MAG TPA: DUF4136 domain-containing protein [Candidatus Acidoferrum sp.]|nr:DUF4136 domain-containing protein [Candidatus Acidoferrum sp.]